MARRSTAEQQAGFVAVRAEAEAREGLELESECDGEFAGPLAGFAEAEGERSGPTAEVTVKGVVLFFEDAIAGFEMVVNPVPPSFR